LDTFALIYCLFVCLVIHLGIFLIFEVLYSNMHLDFSFHSV